MIDLLEEIDEDRPSLRLPRQAREELEFLLPAGCKREKPARLDSTEARRP
ncbi:hypothetical protein [Paraburkholderia sp. BL6665CI2N2]|nr:hypothetical protein [Paraburkholderia sp. BL6665CI2N2]